nr:MAG TPA: winged helix-turn-helix DNA-binding protein [Caudoviricetes sp.]
MSNRKTRRAKVSTRWTCYQLIAALAHRGWGPLREGIPGLVHILQAISHTVDPYTGTGYTTAPQLADAAYKSERWVRHCINQLDALGVIEWYPGGIKDGRPAPSFVKIVKNVLVELIEVAQESHDARMLERRAQFEARVRRLPRRGWVRNPRATNRRKMREALVLHAKQSRAKYQPEAGAHPTPIREGTIGSPSLNKDLSTDQQERIRLAKEKIKLSSQQYQKRRAENADRRAYLAMERAKEIAKRVSPSRKSAITPLSQPPSGHTVDITEEARAKALAALAAWNPQK